MGSQKRAKEGGVQGFKVETVSGATPAEVLGILERVGTKQGGTQVQCKLLAGAEEGKIMRRNVFGPVRIGDILILREIEIEANPMKGRKG